MILICYGCPLLTLLLAAKSKRRCALPKCCPTYIALLLPLSFFYTYNSPVKVSIWKIYHFHFLLQGSPHVGERMFSYKAYEKVKFFWEWPLYHWSINQRSKTTTNSNTCLIQILKKIINDHQYCTDNDAFGNILMLVGCPLIPQHHPSLIDREP